MKGDDCKDRERSQSVDISTIRGMKIVLRQFCAGRSIYSGQCASFRYMSSLLGGNRRLANQPSKIRCQISPKITGSGCRDMVLVRI